MSAAEAADQERRITYSLYENWEAIAGKTGIPMLKGMRQEDIAPFKDNLVLLDLRNESSPPKFQVIGKKLKLDLDIELTNKPINKVPRRTMLSRVSDHYLEVIANRAPIAFEAEFVNTDQEKALYRGILLPFSDDNKRINFILGGVRWILEKDLNLDQGEPSIEELMQEIAQGRGLDPEQILITPESEISAEQDHHEEPESDIVVEEDVIEEEIIGELPEPESDDSEPEEAESDIAVEEEIIDEVEDDEVILELEEPEEAEIAANEEDVIEEEIIGELPEPESDDSEPEEAESDIAVEEEIIDEVEDDEVILELEEPEEAEIAANEEDVIEEDIIEEDIIGELPEPETDDVTVDTPSIEEFMSAGAKIEEPEEIEAAAPVEDKADKEEIIIEDEIETEIEAVIEDDINTEPQQPLSTEETSTTNTDIKKDSIAGPDLRSALKQIISYIKKDDANHNRSRESLYNILAAIYGFYENCQEQPEIYNQIVNEHKLKIQARAPFTPLLKICIGKNYDKTRLTEYAAALSLARHMNIDIEEFPSFIKNFPGGIKGCVREIRSLRKQGNKAAPLPAKVRTIKEAKDIIRALPSIGNFKLKKMIVGPSDPEFFLLLAKRRGHSIDILKILDDKFTKIDTIIKQTAFQKRTRK